MLYEVEDPRISLDIGRLESFEDITDQALTPDTFAVSLMVWGRPMVDR